MMAGSGDRAERAIGILESAASVLLLGGMFGAILIQVFFRYVLRDPLIWPYEFSIYCYIYTVFIGAAIATRRKSNIAFDLVYNRFSVRSRLLIESLSNTAIVVILVVVLRATIPYIRFIGGVPSSALGIPLSLVLSSFPTGLGLVVIYLCLQTVSDVREYRRLGRDG
jgi:TRAP-type C4-dicarboxylate transport system permease small subunit